MDEQKRADFLEQLAEDLRGQSSRGSYPGSSIAWLLSLHVEDLPEWRWRWIDDLLDAQVEIKDRSVEVLGYIVWGNQGTAGQWTDPLRAVFTKDAQEKITGYELQFCDAERSSQPFEAVRNHRPTADIDWTYRFAWQDRSVA